MGTNITSGIIGAVLGGIVLYFVLGIPSEVRSIDIRVARLEGQFNMLTTLTKEVKALQSRVEEVQATVANFPTPTEDDLLVSGVVGSSNRWGSGWIDLDVTMDFKTGDRLRLTIGGTANKIKVRLHGGSNPWGAFPLGGGNGPATLEKVELIRR